MEVVNVLTNLVGFPVLGGQSNRSIIEYIGHYLHQLGIEYHLVENTEEDKASLHCRIGPAVDGGVILSGHTDVVPVEGQPWDTDPFVLTPQNGKLFGRGSADMKGFVACCLASAEKMKQADLKKPIYFAFSYDEEVGCLAAPELVANINKGYEEKPQYAIIGEPSLMKPIIGQKGICIFQTTVNGSEGHSSRIKREVSAIHEAAALILWLEQYMDGLIERQHLDDRFDPNHTSVHIGKIKGGIATNVIADECQFNWDVRNIPMDKAMDVLGDFEAFCRERETIRRKVFPDFKIVTTTLHPPVPALDTAEQNDVVSLVKVLTQEHATETVSYAAEAGQFAEGGFESIICGPGDIAQAHRANEFIEVVQLEKCMQFLEKLTGRLSQ